MTRLRRLLAGLLLGALLLTGCTATTPEATTGTETAVPSAVGSLWLCFVNVGDGDGAVLFLPDGAAVVMDTGPADGYEALMDVLVSRGVTRLEAIFISHAHEDHTANLAALLSYFTVDAVYAGPLLTDDQEQLLDNSGVPWYTVSQGDRITLSGLTAQVLSPVGLQYDQENDNSAVIRFLWGQTAFLFPGDAGTLPEQVIIASGADLSAQVLKAGHHGAADATSAAWLSKVKPEYVVVSTYSEDQLLPDEDTIQRVEQAGAQLYITQQDGNIWFVSDGQTVEKRTPEEDTSALAAISIAQLDKKLDYVRLINNDDVSVDIGGYSLLSERGDEVYYIPLGTTLGPGAELTVCSLERLVTADLIWPEKNIFSNKKDDAAVLRDRSGRVLSRAES